MDIPVDESTYNEQWMNKNNEQDDFQPKVIKGKLSGKRWGVVVQWGYSSCMNDPSYGAKVRGFESSSRLFFFLLLADDSVFLLVPNAIRNERALGKTRRRTQARPQEGGQERHEKKAGAVTWI